MSENTLPAQEEIKLTQQTPTNAIDKINKTFYDQFHASNNKYDVFVKDPFEWGIGTTNIYTGLIKPQSPLSNSRIPARLDPPIYAENTGTTIKYVLQNTLSNQQYIEFSKSGDEFSNIKQAILNITNKSTMIFYESLVKSLFDDKIDEEYKQWINDYLTKLTPIKEKIEKNKQAINYFNGLDLRAKIDELSFKFEQAYKDNSNDKSIIANSTKSNQVLIISKKLMLEIRSSQTNDYQNWDTLSGFHKVITIDSDNNIFYIIDKNALGIRIKYNKELTQDFGMADEVDYYTHIWLDFAFLEKMVCRKFEATKQAS